MSKRNPSLGAFSASVMRCALLAALSIAPLAARAEAARADPIDTAMQNCSARADRSSTPGQVQCIEAARDAWQQAIDGAMRVIAANAPDDQKRGWALSQERWLAWRKDEQALLRAVFATTRGSSYSITEANVLLQSVRDRALAVRHAASRFAPVAPAVRGTAASGALAPGSSSTATSAAGASAAADAPAVASPAATRVQSDDARAHYARLRPCNADGACEHAQFDLRRYERTLREKLPVRARSTLARAQRAWSSYFDATSPLGTEAERADLIGERVATIKRLSETVGGD
ncbi:lysozyme inhibitor LprI family protein [Trinickia diaoshuihuensis]|uniref:lysozyme inhibitor LprI family protein n=1 Tax=Trinickia diaoshuihuensis TaxID=2292265 RepID=UPI000E281FCD|nr:lysozyme inhibitor LprI family protein [Trinickia diaoshuihuensis]